MQPHSPVRIQFGVRGWAAIAVGIVLLAAIVFLAVGVFIFLLPVLLIAPILFWFLPKPRIYRVGTPPENPSSPDATIIEGDFNVVDPAGKLKPPSP